MTILYIRLLGTPDDVAAAAKQIGRAFTIVEESQNYRCNVTNPGDNRVRRYIKVRPRGLEKEPTQ